MNCRPVIIAMMFTLGIALPTLAQGPIVDQILVNDKRLANLQGTYNFSSFPLQVQVQISYAPGINVPSLTVNMSGSTPQPVSVALTPRYDKSASTLTSTWRAKAKVEPEGSVEVVCTLAADGNHMIHVRVLDVGDITAHWELPFVPQQSGYGLRLDVPTIDGKKYQYAVTGQSFSTYAAMKQPKVSSKSTLKWNGTGVKGKVSGELVDNGNGTYSFQVHPTKLSGIQVGGAKLLVAPEMLEVTFQQ